ncbi:MAG: phage tail spike protein, partial [Bacilli bacterium]
MARLLETLNPIEALVHETLNGEYELTFTTTARDVNKFDLLSAHTPNGRQLFRVAGVTNHADKSEIFARHVFFDLSGNFSLGFESKDVTCQTMINKFVSSLTEPLAPFALSTDITARNSYNPEEANALEILSHGKRSIVGVNDAELLRDNYAVKLQKRLGSDTNVLIHPRNNILDLKREYSSDDICTKIFLRGGTEEAPLEATITSPLIDKYPVVYARRYQNETESITTVEQLIAWGKLHFDTDRIDVPKLSFDFDVFGDLGLQLGDSALVRVPELDVDVRSRVTGYDYDPMTRKYVKLYFGDKSTGLAGFIGDTTTGIVDEAVKNVDEKLQAEIDNANEAIQKEYEARVEAVNDAIAKAEADAEVMKEELQTEISQAVTDWNTEFEEAKTQIDNSIGSVSKELDEYIKSTDEIIAEHDDLFVNTNIAIGNMNTEIGNAKNDISDLFESTEANQGAIVTVSNNLGTLSTKVSNVETTANTANATASEVKQTASELTSTVSSLQGTVNTATGDITKLKSDVTTVTQTATSLSSKVTSLESDNVTNKQNIASVTQTADGLKNEVSSVTTTANTALAKATTVEQTASGLSSKVTSLETSDGVQNSAISSLEQTANGLTSTVSSHTTEINGLNTTVSTHTSEIKQTSDKISMVVSNGSTASAVQLTPNALTAIAKDINLKGNVQFDSLVEGDGTNTQILGGKIKTNSISANKLILSDTQNLLSFVAGEDLKNSTVTWASPYFHANFPDQANCSLTYIREPVRSRDWVNKNITLRIKGSIWRGSSSRFRFEVHFYKGLASNSDWKRGVYSPFISPTGHEGVIDITMNLGTIAHDEEAYYIRITKETPDTAVYGVQGLSILQMNAGELIVDGAIKANHIVSGSAELGAVTSKVLSTEALNAAWANIGNAIINKLTSDDALFQRLTAKSAWITSANIVSLEASSIKGKVLSSTNGGLKFDLDGNRLWLTENSRIAYWNSDTQIVAETRYGTNAYLPSQSPDINNSL